MSSNKVFKVDWVLSNELAIGPAPSNQENLNMLKKLNISSILTLCSEEEIETVENIEKIFKVERIVLPDHKSGKFPTISEIYQTLDKLKELKKNGRVYVHCVASVERSPLICMAWLIREHKLKPREALDYIMEIHKGTSPLSGQYSLLLEIFNDNNKN